MRRWHIGAVLLLISVLLLVNSCGEGNMNGSAVPLKQNQEDRQKHSIATTTPSLQADQLQLSSKVIEGDFELIMYTEKTHYEVDEPIKVYAELVYVGEKEQIDIGHSMYPIGFNTSEHTRSLYMMGAMNEPYIVTTLKRGEPIRYEYQFTGGYSSDEDQEHIDFINDLIDNQFLVGQYTITAQANFSEHFELEEQQDDGQLSDSKDSQSRTHYNFSGTISFIVGSGN